MQSEKDTLIERYASDAFKNRNNPDLPLGVWRQHFVEFADKLAALSTDAEPVAYGVFTKNRDQPDYRFSNLCSDTNDDANELGREYFTDQFIVKPLYAEPVKTAPSVAVKALEWVQMDDGETYHAQSILGRWARWEGHYLPPEGYGGIACVDPIVAAQADYDARIRSALSAQVQDVAGHEPYGTPGADAMRVIDPDQWEPCSPSYLSRGGCCAKAPRVWNAESLNHWHPKLPASPASKHGVP